MARLQTFLRCDNCQQKWSNDYQKWGLLNGGSKENKITKVLLLKPAVKGVTNSNY